MINKIIKNDIAHVIFDAENASVNSLNKATIEAFELVMNEVLSDETIQGIIFRSAKKDFIVGADLKEIMASDNVDEIMELSRKHNAMIRLIECSGKTVVACINGTALGGGFELCLASHYRITLSNPKIQIGLPEVTIGLLPGGGGTQRLPRLIGIQSALNLMAEGKKLNPKQALEAGLIDFVVDTEDELIKKAEDLIKNNPKTTQNWDIRGYKIPGGAANSPENMMLFGAGAALILKKTFGNYPAPINILRAVQEGLQVPFDRALKIEERYFENCLRSPISKNMIRTLFLNMGETSKVPKSNTEFHEIKKVGIIGAGMMGSGIAYAAALSGSEVVLKDMNLEASEKGKDYSVKICSALQSKGKMNEEKAQNLLSKIHPSDSYNDLKNCDLIIEAVFENREIKAEVTRESEKQIETNAIFASNTSTLPISGLAEASVRPENFIGLHFFSPVEKMQLVEIIRGAKTSEYAVNQCIQFVLKLKKIPVTVNDGRGFFTSRIFTTYIFEGLELLAEGVPPAMIENCGKAAGMPVGPLAVADEVSLDLIYKIMKQTELDMSSTYQNAGAAIIKEMVEKHQRIGRKNGKGFYEYPSDGTPKFLWPELKKLFPQKDTLPDADLVKKRLLYIQSVESAKCMEEGIIQKAADADIASILGWGFPPYTGGVLSFIDMVGIREFTNECEAFEKLYGKRFAPCNMLKEMSEKGIGFYE